MCICPTYHISTCLSACGRGSQRPSFEWVVQACQSSCIFNQCHRWAELATPNTIVVAQLIVHKSKNKLPRNSVDIFTNDLNICPLNTEVMSPASKFTMYFYLPVHTYFRHLWPEGKSFAKPFLMSCPEENLICYKCKRQHFLHFCFIFLTTENENGILLCGKDSVNAILKRLS